MNLKDKITVLVSQADQKNPEADKSYSEVSQEIIDVLYDAERELNNKLRVDMLLLMAAGLLLIGVSLHYWLIDLLVVLMGIALLGMGIIAYLMVRMDRQ